MTTFGAPVELPPAFADLLAPELPGISDEIVRTIGEEVPEYMRPLGGAFGRGVRAGVTQALERFLALIRDPLVSDPELRRPYVALGRDEFRAGRTLDALQAAYRVGARVAWRRIAAVSIAAGVAPENLAGLADAMFAYIDELSAESVEGFAQAQSELAGERQRRRRVLAEALLRPSTPPHELARLAEEASWTPPATAAALACEPEDAARLARRLGAEVLAARIDGIGCAIVPDAEAPGRRDALRAACGARPASIGPNGALSDLHRSWGLARGTMEIRGDDAGVDWADAHLAELLLHDAADVVERIVEHRLAGLHGLTPAARERTLVTALAYLQHRANAPAMARALHIHPQTARYRINRLRELLGEQLDDPAAGFELEAALRRALRTSSG